MVGVYSEPIETAWRLIIQLAIDVIPYFGATHLMEIFTSTETMVSTDATGGERASLCLLIIGF